VQKAKRNTLEFLFGTAATTYNKGSQSWTLRFKTPSWWSGVIYELSSHPQISTYRFRTYNVVHHGSEILRSVQEGDSNKVRHLFQTRQASPYDVDAKGHSLLHVRIPRKSQWLG
jgi:hypothetical protein